MLTAALVVGPLLMLGADALYAFQGWDSGALASSTSSEPSATASSSCASPPGCTTDPGCDRSPRRASPVRSATPPTGSRRSTSRSVTPRSSIGPEPPVIKPLGLLFPLCLALVAVALRRLGRRACCGRACRRCGVARRPHHQHRTAGRRRERSAGHCPGHALRFVSGRALPTACVSPRTSARPGMVKRSSVLATWRRSVPLHAAERPRIGHVGRWNPASSL